MTALTPDADRRLRVAYLASSLRPGGSEGQMLALAERLPRERFRVDFITMSEPGPYAARAEAAGARVFSLGPAPAAELPAVSRLVKRTRKTLRYLSVVRSRRHHIVDAWLYPTYDLAALTRHLTRVPIVVAGRRNLSGLDGRLGPLAAQIDAVAGRLSDAVVANSAAVAEDTLARERLDPGRLRVIRNGVDLIEPLSADARLAQRMRWTSDPNALIVGCVANYREVKALDILIEAVADLMPELPGLHLVLVGEGPTRPSLERQISESGLVGRVHLHGRELDPRPLFSAFDVVAFASRSEGLPNALLEAAAAGRPIVATRVGGIPEIVLDGQTGILVSVDDPSALARALRILADDPARRAAMGAAGREHVDRTFGMSRFVAEFAALYEGLARAKGIGG